MGSSMSEQRLREELLKQEFSSTSVDRAIYQLIAKEILAYTDRRTKIQRIRL
jgi:DNA replication licensing factor MCM5